MCLSNAFLADELHFDLLAGPQLRDQYIIVQWLWLRYAFLGKSLSLIADWEPLEVARVDISVVEMHFFVLDVQDLRQWGARVLPGAGDMQLEP